MKLRLALVALSALALAACSGGPRQGYARYLKPVANPSKVVAAELAFARAAQQDGQWTAFARFATGDAVMFVPEPVNAQSWLRGRANPAQAVKWQPHEVWSSCDGSLAVTRGAWQRPDGSQGYFTTVWERQGDGDYKWVLDQGDVLAQPLAAPEFVQTTVADCGGEDAIAVAEGAWIDGLPANSSGSSRDHTLAYEWKVEPDLSRRLAVSLMIGGSARTVLESKVDAPQ